MNKIQKIVNEENKHFDDFLEKIELIYYDNKYTDDIEKNKKHEIVYNDLIENNEANKLCRNEIDEDYIQETFLDENIMGYIAKINDDYVGFILFKKLNKNHNKLYLSLVATKPKTGMPLGQILIAIMEKVAKEINIHTIIADSIEGALNFYMKNNWEVFQKDEEANTYLIEKQIREKDFYEIQEELNDFRLKIQEELNELNKHQGYLRRIFNYAYSFFS